MGGPEGWGLGEVGGEREAEVLGWRQSPVLPPMSLSKLITILSTAPGLSFAELVLLIIFGILNEEFSTF